MCIAFEVKISRINSIFGEIDGARYGRIGEQDGDDVVDSTLNPSLSSSIEESSIKRDLGRGLMEPESEQRLKSLTAKEDTEVSHDLDVQR